MIPLLEVMICTYRHVGLKRVAEMNLPKVPQVGYLVSCQSDPMDLPDSLVREDIRVVFTPTIGLSNNRNNALYNVMAPYALVADDDEIFDADGLKKIIEVFNSHPDVDIATFICHYPESSSYPPYEHDISRPYKNYNIVSLEIALRMSSIRSLGLIFSPLMGIGAKYLHAGEENTFVLSGLKKGLKGRFFPIVIAEHPQPTTTGRQRQDPAVIRATGAYVMLAYPLTAAMRLPLIAKRKGGNILNSLYHLTWGALYALRHRHTLLNPHSPHP